MAMSLTLLCGIEPTDGAPKKTRRKANQYLTPAEEKALAQYLKHMADLGYPVPIKHLRLLMFSIARRRFPATAAIKPPGKNWPKNFREMTSRARVKKSQGGRLELS